jgi:hypothetical protein
MVTMNIIARTSSNLLDPKEKIVLTPDEISEREFGSKMVLVTEQMQLLTIWLVKGCLLIMFNRLTYVSATNLWSPRPLTNILQYESPAESRCQNCRRIRCCQLCRHGDFVPRRVVQTFQPILGRPARQW